MAKTTVPQHLTLTAAAAAFAVRAHEGQKRKGTKFPYSTHPIGVGHLLREYYPSDPALEAAGYLHDVLEDTDVSEMELRARFGDDIVNLVVGVTNTGNWRLSDHVGEPRILRLKAADTLDNVLDTVRGLQKGHDVWQRFAAGRRKAETWSKHADLLHEHLAGEPLACRVRDVVFQVQRTPVRDTHG